MTKNMKQISSALMICFFLQAAVFPQSYALGDINHSGNIDIVDALLAAQRYVGLNPPNFDASLADVNASGGIDIIDALLIAQYYVGLINKFPGQGNNCTGTGRVTYTLAKAASPTAEQRTAYNLITEAMDTAVSYYNCYTNIVKSLNVTYVPGVPTADGNINGSIRFGGQAYMNHITAMHEISHTVGVGTHSRWSSLVANGLFTGINATNQLRAITGNQQDVLHADSQHFWPYGLNYTSEVKDTSDLINHCKIVSAILKDLGA